MQTQSPYQSLLRQLDAFIRKFYVNEFLRGIIFTMIYVLLFFEAINLLEYYLYLPKLLRALLFWSFILSSVAIIVAWIGIPLLKYFRLGKTISYEQASKIIGEHFAEVQDKLLNILQLKNAATSDDETLINASINQKINALSPVTFSSAIDLGQNKKYIPYLFVPLAVFVGIFLVAPKIFEQGTTRLYHSNTTFEKEAPFKFIIENKSLQTQQYENFELRATTEGEALPAEVFIETEGVEIKMNSIQKNGFLHVFSNVQKDIRFRLSANGFFSKEYILKVSAKPVIKLYEVVANYPSYTGKQNETIVNAGDLTVPQGTKLTWKLKTQNVSALQFHFAEAAPLATKKEDNVFEFSKTFLQSESYSLKLSGAEIANADSMTYTISVIADEYPKIAVTEKRDSLNDRFFFYLGEASDDYGLKKLTFNYQIFSAEENTSTANEKSAKSIEISIPQTSATHFQYFWNVNEFGLQPEDKMTYFFEVWDNDAIHGSKSTKSTLMTFAMPSEAQMQKELAQADKAIKDDLKKSMKDAKALQKEMQELQNKLLEKKSLSWEDKKAIQELLNKQKELQKQLDQMKNEFAHNTQKKNEIKQQSEAIQEKQKQLQELFNAVMNDEMKKLQAQLEKMLDELQKKDALQKMDEMKASTEKTEKELDRMLELMKKLELDQRLEDAINKLDKLSEKQEKLAQETALKNQEKEAQKQLEEKQQKLNEEFQQAQKDLNDIEQKAKESETKTDTKEAQSEMDKAAQDMNDALQDIQQQNNPSASKNQKSAAKEMKSASQKLAQMKQKMQEEEQAEDMAALRQLLKNILTLSFDQEKLMTELKQININNPKYPELMKEQSRIRENSEMVEDSLYALAKRVFKIKSFVTKQITDINRNLQLSIEGLEARNTYKAAGNQQFVMTGLNNLALMLSETQKEMQMDMQQQSDQQGGTPMMCKKPGGGKPNLSQMQKQLSDKISQLGEKMKKDGQSGKDGNPQQGLQNGKQYSKEFAEIAAQQAMLRNALQQLDAQENKGGKEGSLGNLGDAIKKMEQNETDLVNKRLTGELLRRQQEITVRLLEVEKAQRERGEKEERESNAGKNENRAMPPSLEEYLKQQKNITEQYKTVPPTLKPFYKELSEKYFKTVTN